MLKFCMPFTAPSQEAMKHVPMKRSLFMNCLRVLAVASSVSLLGGYVWFTQRKAQLSAATTEPAGVKGDSPFEVSIATASQTAEGEPVTVMLSSKNISQPIFSSRAVKEVDEGVAMERQHAPESPSPAPAPVPPSGHGVWVLSGSKSYNGGVTVGADLLQNLVTSPANAPAVSGGASSPEAKTKVVMAGSKSGTVTLIDAPRPPIELRGSLGKLNVKAGSGGVVGFPERSEIDAPAPPPRKVPENGALRTLSGSKSTTVFPPPPFEVDGPSTASTTGIMDPRRFVPSLRWDLGEAMHELEQQMKSGLGLKVPNVPFPGTTSGSVPDPALSPKVPSVLALPDRPTPASTP